MVDMTLHGNGDDCPACDLRREDLKAERSMSQSVECNFCKGVGRVPRDTAEIIREACEWARANYWPAKEEKWRNQEERNDGLH